VPKYWQKKRAQNVDEIDTWGQFHQHAYTQLLRVQMLWLSTIIFPTIPTLPVHLTL